MFRRNLKNLSNETEWRISTPPRRYGRILLKLLTVGVVLTALLLLAFGSQKHHGYPENMDKAFLDDAIVSASPIADAIFPLAKGQKQVYQVTSDPNKPELTNKITEFRETKDTKLAVMQTTYNQNLISVRAYAAAPKGLLLVALGSSEPLRFQPPLPLIRFPVKFNETYSWSGTLTGKKTKMLGYALVRVAGAENLVQDKIKRVAYRLDMIIATKKQDKFERQQTTLWFAPNVGLVREQTYIDGHPFICELKLETPIP